MSSDLIYINTRLQLTDSDCYASSYFEDSAIFIYDTKYGSPSDEPVVTFVDCYIESLFIDDDGCDYISKRRWELRFIGCSMSPQAFKYLSEYGSDIMNIDIDLCDSVIAEDLLDE